MAQVEGRRVRREVAKAGGAAAFLAAGAAAWREAGVGEAGRARLARALREGTAERTLAEAVRRGLALLFPGDDGYPAPLTHLSDPPPFLFVAGSVDALSAPHAAAVVGTRAASPEALTYAERMGADLARAGCVVVSGGARGIDAAAHRGALAASKASTAASKASTARAGTTVVVLGSGHLAAYPAEHKGLFRKVVAEGGAVVSEFPPTARPEKSNFPRRNRLIAALAQVLVVVEAPAKSGALSTARHALDLGREVFVGPLLAPAGPRNAGTRAMAEDGAPVADDAGAVLSALGLASVGPAPLKEATPEPAVLRAEEIAAKEGISFGAAERRLMDMEEKGEVERLPDGTYRRRGY